jgi:uncharacterized protein (TIGR03032 family)
MSPSPPPQQPSEEIDSGGSHRLIKYEHSLNLAPLLGQLGVTLLVTTYQAGKLVVVGSHQGALALSVHNFHRAMGLAVKADRWAVGTQDSIWYLRAAPDLAFRIEPVGRHDGCFLARTSFFTGDVQAHELAWAGEELWIVNTLFSCLCTLDEKYSFVPRWRPLFISSLAAEDRCHLNGLALGRDERGVLAPRFVTAMSETDTAQGWRPVKASAGCLISVPDGAIVSRGLVMPHSPRLDQGGIWLLDSGRGRLVRVDPVDGQLQAIAELPGYTRGLALHGPFAFVGLSKIRETSTFGGVPVAEKRDQLKCGVAVVQRTTGQHVAFLEFKEGIDEIFDVQVLPGARFPAVSGPYPQLDGGKTIWTVPQSGA